MDIEIIPDTGISEKDCESFRLVRDGDVSNYYVTMKNNGGHCPCCGSYVKKAKKMLAKWAYFLYNNSARKFSVVLHHTPGDLSLP